MSQQCERPAVIWMDRLSDRIGALVPGLRFLPPRYPLKVSLVLGILGLMSAWAEMGILALSQLNLPVLGMDLFRFVAGFAFGTIVLAPWAHWAGLTKRSIIWLVIYSTAVYYAADQISLWFTRGSNPLMAAVLWGLIISASLGLAGMISMGRWHLAWFLWNVTVCVTISLLLGFIFTETQRRPEILRFIPFGLQTLVLLAAYFTTFQTASALCLGMLLWDATPPPKFEAEEDATGAESP